MLSPEKNQVEICLLKANLEEIEHELVAQSTAWPKLDAEHQQKHQEILDLLKVSRGLSVEYEQLKEENVRLSAKRMNLKMKSEWLSKATQKARDENSAMQREIDDLNRDIELIIRNYEDQLRERAAQFRATRVCFDDAEMEREIEKVQESIRAVGKELEGRRAKVETLRKQLHELAPSVPEDLLNIVGRPELLDKAQSLLEKRDRLQEKLNDLLKKKNNASS